MMNSERRMPAVLKLEGSWNQFIRVLVVCAACCSAGVARRVHGQEPQENIKGRIGYSIALVSPAGTYAYVPGSWGILHVHLVNPLNEPVNLLTTTYFDGNPTLQYGRRVWLPARSRMKTWHPILLPSAASENDRYNIHTLVMQSEPGREVLIRSDSGYLQLDGSLKTIPDRPVTGLLEHLATDSEQESNDNSAFDLIITSRMSQGLKRHVSGLTDNSSPPGEESLAPLDQLVIGSSRALNDAAAIDSIRHWLYGGGRLWILLDRVDSSLLERLLGDDFNGEVVDTVPLTHFAIESRTSGLSVTRTEYEHEAPIDFVRVLIDDVNVAARIDGWPAAWWTDCGEGKLLVTTLGPRGWMKRRPPTTDREVRRRANLPPDAEEKTPGAENTVNPADLPAFVPVDAMLELAADFYAPRPESLVPQQLFEEQIQEYVGYSIPPRWAIVSLLVGFGLLLAGAGAWLWHAGRLEWLAAVGTVSALGVATVLVFLGRQQRDAVPESVATVQFVRSFPGTDDIRAEGFAGLYATEPGDSAISATQGGLFIPELAGTEGQTRRMIWTDANEWRWENLSKSAGLRRAWMRESRIAPERVAAKGVFGPDGLSGTLTIGDEHVPTDPIVVTRNGRIGVQLGADHSFVVANDDVFADEQFVAADLLSDEQNRRRQILQEILTNPKRLDYPRTPMMIFWTSPWDLGFQFEEGMREFGSALVTVPLELVRPADGTEVGLSPPFLPFRAVHGPDDIAPSGMYNYRDRIWTKKADPSTSWFRFQIPEVLLPVEFVSGRVALQVSGPIGKVEVAGVRGDKAVPLQTWVDPVGKITFDLTDRELLPISEDGGLLLRVSGGDPDRPELTRPDGDRVGRANYWQIESLKIDLRVRTVPDGAQDAPNTAGN
jgi:hypothetical protein